MKTAAEAARERLERLCKEYARRRDLMRQQVSQLSGELERRMATLAREPQASAIDAMEAKLKSSEQTVFALRECEWPCGGDGAGCQGASLCSLLSR